MACCTRNCCTCTCASCNRSQSSPPTSHALQTKQQLQFRLPLGKPALAFMWDHQVQSAPLLPGAAYFEMAAASARALLRLPGPAVVLTGAAIAAPLRLPASQQAAHVVVSAEVALTSGDFSIRSASLAEPADPTKPRGRAGRKSAAAVAPETLHLRGSLAAVMPDAIQAAPAAPDVAAALSADAVRAACQRPQDTAAVYRGLHAAGLHYGPAFRQLRSVQAGASSASAQLGSGNLLQGQRDVDVSGFLLHPALLDSCLQLGALVPEPAVGTTESPQAGAYVPAGLSAYMLQQAVQQGSSAVAVVRRSPEAMRLAAGATYRDHTLLDGSGAVMAVLQGLEAKQLPSGIASRPAAAAGVTVEPPHVAYEVAWQTASIALAGSLANIASFDGAALALALSRRTVILPLATAGTGLAVLQQAAQQQVDAVELQTSAPVLPASAAPASNAAVDGTGSSALWGMLRSFAQEAPAVSHGGRHTDPLATTARARTMIAAGRSGATDRAADGYGVVQHAGTASHAVLLPSRKMHVAAAVPYHLMPIPRGAFGSLKSQPVSVGAAQPGWVEVQVKAVGINFR